MDGVGQRERGPIHVAPRGFYDSAIRRETRGAIVDGLMEVDGRGRLPKGQKIAREHEPLYVVSLWIEERKMRNGHIQSALLLVTFAHSGRNGVDAGRKRRK